LNQSSSEKIKREKRNKQSDYLDRREEQLWCRRESTGSKIESSPAVVFSLAPSSFVRLYNNNNNDEGAYRKIGATNESRGEKTQSLMKRERIKEKVSTQIASLLFQMRSS
jgi:hypothetical protein